MDKGKGAPYKKTSSKSINITASSSTTKAATPEDQCPCSEGQTQTSFFKSSAAGRQIQGPSRLAVPSAGVTRTAGSGRSPSRTPQTGATRVPIINTLQVPPTSSRIAQTTPQLVRSSVTTTVRDAAGKPIETSTSTRKSYISQGIPVSATNAKMRTTGSSRLQVPKIKITAPASSTPTTPYSSGVPPFLESSHLAKKVQKDLMQMSHSTGTPASATGTKTSMLLQPPSVIKTKKGPVAAINEIVLERKVERGTEGEHVSELMTGLKHDEGKKLELNVQHFDPSSGLPPASGTSSEVIMVKSSISTAADVMQKVKTVVHETTNIDAKEVSKMVEEENETVEEGLRMLKIKSKSPPKSPQQKELVEEAPEDLQPEMLAAIMHTEEQGLAMAAPPIQLYKILFPDEGEPGSIPVSSVVPAPLQDVVVPTSAPDWYGSFTKEELVQTLAEITEKLQASPKKPKDNMYEEAVKKFVLQSPPSPFIPAIRKRKKVKPVGEEKAPWDAEDFQPIADLVGASVSAAGPPNFDLSLTEPERMFPTDTSGLEYILVPRPPSHVSRVQLRGSTKPLWFPGYYVALPERGRGINLTSSPSGVLASAWKEFQPRTFGENPLVS